MADRSCPYLGLKDDPATYSAYPSLKNHCHRVEAGDAVNLTHQRSYCTTSDYEGCPVFQAEDLKKLPETFRAKKKAQVWKGWRLTAGGLVVLTLLSAVGMELGLLPYPMERPRPTSTEPAAVLPAPTEISPTETQVPTRTPAATTTRAVSTPTREASLTPSPFPTPGPALETPFGPDRRYLVHSVKDGESFGFLEERYGTTEAVIRTTNQLIPGVDLWPGTVLVVIPGEIDPADLPSFKVMYVDQPAKVSVLAEQFEVEPARVRRYNSLGEEELIQPGRWLIIPDREGA